MSSTYKRKIDKTMHSNIQLYLDNQSKLDIVDKIKLFNEKLKNDSSDHPIKDDMVSFLKGGSNSMQLSHDGTKSSLPRGTAMHHEGMKRHNETGDRAKKLQSYLDD